MNAATPLVSGISRSYLAHHRVCPLRQATSRTSDEQVLAQPSLVVAVTSGSLLDALDDLSIAYGSPVTTVTVAPRELDRLLAQLAVPADEVVVEGEGEGPDAGPTGDGALADVRDLANQPPVIRYVNLLIREAFGARASDIHVEATRDGNLTVRFRLDGVLVDAMQPPPAAIAPAVVSRLKLLAELDIAERRRPQDGRIRVRLESRELDLRVSTVPTLHGESVVLRLLERGGRPVELSSLGMTPEVLRKAQWLCLLAHGMIIVTGPTGSGKTTTMYAMIIGRPTRAEKIITVEDPVEYELEGVAQVPVDRQRGVTIASALRSILRQDPDVIMVGEIRDAETAEVAIQAAMTGHLVFSTLHTTDAVGAIPRLLDLGVADYLVSGTLQGILAQRLVRLICDSCRTEYQPSPETVAALCGDAPQGLRLTRGAGCPECRGTGYRGRTGLFELVVMTDEMREAIAGHARRPDLVSIAKSQGTIPLRADGWAKVQAGLTTVEEVVRVTTD